jgi:acetyltransferase-like isoleucine patch superfamily enzyme
MVETYILYACVPILFLLLFISIAAGLSRFAQRGIIAGTFPRDPFHPVYLLRRIYGICWTQVFYFKPLYAIALSIPLLKKYLFRAFGYRGNTDFVIYPDTWIRDLPLLNIGKGAYLSNRATVGTNICLPAGTILVDAIEMEEQSLVGHLTVLAPGVKIGRKVEIGVCSTIGIRTKLAIGSKVNPCCAINHGVVIGEEARVGSMSYIGVKTTIGPRLVIPDGANIPSGFSLNTQEEVAKFFQEETRKIDSYVSKLKERLNENLKNENKI